MGTDHLRRVVTGVADLRHWLTRRARHVFDPLAEPPLDPLTGLGGRGMLTRRAAGLARDEEVRGLLVLDLDGFKAVNDAAGHVAGDAVLREVGRRIRVEAGPDDVPVRLGGDEFAVLTGPLPEPSTDDAGAVAYTDGLAERLCRAIAEPVVTDGLELSVQASVGVAIHTRDGHGLEQLLRAADQAMYAAKARNLRGHRAPGPPGLPMSREPVLAAELAVAIDEGDLVLHYQPQVGWSGEVRGVEALLRWPHPVLGTLVPRQVLPLAERHGLTSRLARWTVERALADRHVLAGLLGPDLRMSVNVAARDLLCHDFLPDIARLIEADGSARSCLIFEIGEPAPHPVPQVVALFDELDQLGVVVSIHEFGLGQISLAAISHHPGVRQIKIDPLLVRQVCDDESTARLVRAIVGAAHGLEVEVVAEGVEDVPTMRRLRELGCDLVQGYVVAAPGDLAATASWAEVWPSRRHTLLAP